jgi:putative serine protease PepD
MVKFNDGRTARTAWSPLIPEVTSQLSELKRSQGLSRSLSDHQADLRIGQPVVAVGSPLGLDDTVTPGVVSGLSRPVCTGADAESLLAVYDAIQTDAALNPGNSGGALVDMNGDLIGVNSAAAAPPGLLVETGNRESGSIGGGFAIPGDYAKRISSELIATGTASHAWLGSRGESSNGHAGRPDYRRDERRPCRVGWTVRWRTRDELR